jgi:hypothetical protein
MAQVEHATFEIDVSPENTGGLAHAEGHTKQEDRFKWVTANDSEECECLCRCERDLIRGSPLLRSSREVNDIPCDAILRCGGFNRFGQDASMCYE